MSKIKELKTNNDNIINLVDVLEMFSPDRKSKYTETLLRLMKATKNINDHFEEIKMSLTNEFKFLTNEDLDKFSPIQLMIIHRFIDSFFNYSDLQSFRRFCEYNERNLIAQNDLTKYKSFDEILTQLSLADLKVETKNLENEIVKIHEDEEWLLLRPLTYLSSKKYGANTKWCTTSEGNSEYFERYSSKGVLIYCMNKKTGYKVASFYSLDKKDPEFSFWNQKDTRIDSLDTELTDELRLLIGRVSKEKGAKTNRYLLSDDQRQKEDTINNRLQHKYSESLLTMSDVMEQPREQEELVMQEPEVGVVDIVQRRNEERRRRERMLLGELTERAPDETISESASVNFGDVLDRMRLNSGTIERNVE
jgi:hypothetical protein